MNILITALLSIAFLVVVMVLLRRSSTVSSDDAMAERNRAPSMGSSRWMDLSERIFDPADARWLAEELAFPALAAALTEQRKQLAIRWLETLQASFDDLVRTPEPALDQDTEAMSTESWKMLWLTVRFKLLVSYALLVVRVFGPYHRLIPSFSWVPLLHGSEHNFGREALVGTRGMR